MSGLSGVWRPNASANELFICDFFVFVQDKAWQHYCERVRFGKADVHANMKFQAYASG
jgi:hypothetical protein